MSNKLWCAFPPPTIQRPVLDLQTGDRVSKTITVPGMSVNMKKALSYVRQHPLDEALLVYGSQNPEVHNKIDITMMSPLDRMRKLNELRMQNSKDRETVRKNVAKDKQHVETLKLKELEKQAIEKHIKSQSQSKETK